MTHSKGLESRFLDNKHFTTHHTLNLKTRIGFGSKGVFNKAIATQIEQHKSEGLFALSKQAKLVNRLFNFLVSFFSQTFLYLCMCVVYFRYSVGRSKINKNQHERVALTFNSPSDISRLSAARVKIPSTVLISPRPGGISKSISGIYINEFMNTFRV